MKVPSSINIHVFSIPNKVSGEKTSGVGKRKKLPPAISDENSNPFTKWHFCTCANDKHNSSVSDRHNSEERYKLKKISTKVFSRQKYNS